MTEEPIAPGRGLPVNQPATVVVAGTCSVPAGVRPSSISWVLTPIAGMTSLAGSATRRWLAASGGATRRPAGIAVSRGGPGQSRACGPWLTITRPVSPAQHSSTPRAATATAR
jgi:hypothetical protein